MTDEAHKGEVGQMYRDELETEMGESLDVEPVEVESSESSGRDSTSSESSSSESSAGFQEESPEDGRPRLPDTDGPAGDLEDDDPEPAEVEIVEEATEAPVMGAGWEPAVAEIESRVDGLAENFTTLHSELVQMEGRLADVEKRVEALEAGRDVVDEDDQHDPDAPRGEDGDGDQEDDVDEDGDGSFGIPIPVSTWTLAAGGLTVLLALWWLRSGSSVESEDDTEEDAQGAQQSAESGRETGLVDGGVDTIEDFADDISEEF